MMITDKLGHEISAGCFIVYGHMAGHSPTLRVGKVLAVKSVNTKMSSPSKWRITVQGVNDDWSWTAPKLLERTSTLQFPERMLVVAEEMLPAAYRALFQKEDL